MGWCLWAHAENISTIHIFLFLALCVCAARDRTQDILQVKKRLYLWTMPSAPPREILGKCSPIKVLTMCF